MKQKLNRNDKIFIIIIMFLTFFIRIYHSGGLTGGDDSEYAQLAFHIIEDPKRAIYPSFPDEPMSYQNIKYARPLAATPIVPFIFIFGYTALSVKLPSIIFATLSVMLLFLILRRQFKKDKFIVYLASILFAFLPFHIMFTKSGFLHSQLTFLILATTFFIIKGLDENKVFYFYLASLTVLANMLTTDFRGLIPLLALAMYTIFKKPTIKQYLHLISACVISLILYLLYILTPCILFNDNSLVDWITMAFSHGMGTYNYTSGKYYSFLPALKLMGKYLVFTPFIGIIFIPMLFGLIISIKRIFSKPHYALWSTLLLSSLLFYINKQPYVERQTIFSPAYVVLSALGIIISYKSYINKKNGKEKNHYLFPTLVLATLCYWVSIIKFFPKLFSFEYKSMYNYSFIFNLVDKYYCGFLILFIIIGFIFYYISTQRKDFRKSAKLAKYTLTVFVLVNIITAFVLVGFNIGTFNRPNAEKSISDYIKKNVSNEKYACISYNEDKTITYYIQRICVNYKKVNVTWIEEQTKKGDLKYFIINLYQRKVGVGNIETRADISKYFPEIYEWIMENTMDITEKTGLSPNNPYFRLYIIKSV